MRDFVYVARRRRGTARGDGARARRGAPVSNVWTGRQTSVRALGDTIAGLLGVHAEIRQRGPRAGEVRHSVGDPARGRAALGPRRADAAGPGACRDARFGAA